MTYRGELIKASVEGHKWREKDNKRLITDRKMVDLANKLNGWAESVYRFRCAFVHLSSFHGYKKHDPMKMISDKERNAILKHMRHYHGGPLGSAPDLSDLTPYLPQAFDKITSNLEQGKTIEQAD